MKAHDRDLAGHAPMPQLLDSLGFTVNIRTRRCCCILHGGNNPTAFSWTEQGLWKCHSCGAGGNKVALVRAARKCSYLEAIQFIAQLIRVEVDWRGTSGVKPRQRVQNRKAENRAARLLVSAERALLLDLSHELDALRKIRQRAAAALAQGRNDPETCWAALSFVATALSRTDAAYCILAFGPPMDRARFALHPELSSELVDGALERGFVVDAKGYRVEVPLQ
jgi:hypothetical protein